MFPTFSVLVQLYFHGTTVFCYEITLGVYLLDMLYSCVVMVYATNVHTNYLIQIDTDFYRIVDHKYRLPSQTCGRSDIDLSKIG